MVGAEHVAIHPRRSLGALEIALQEIGGDLSLGAGRERHQPLGITGQDLVVHAGAVIETLEEGQRRQPHEVVEAPLVARQQHQMVGRVARAIGALAAGDVGLDADDRLDAGFSGLLIELDRSEHHAVVRQRERRHLQLGSTLDHARDGIRPIEQRIVAVVMEMYEVGMLHRWNLR